MWAAIAQKRTALLGHVQHSSPSKCRLEEEEEEEDSMSGMLARLSHLVVNRPLRFVLVWFFFGLVVIALCPRLGAYTSSSAGAGLSSSYESTRATQLADRSFPSATNATGAVAVSNVSGGKLSATALSTVIPEVAKSVNAAGISGLTGVSLAQLSTDGTVEIMNVQFAGPAGDATVNDAVASLRHELDAEFAGTGLRGQLTGSASISTDTTSAYAHAQLILTIFTILGIVLVLGLVFRSVLIAVIPVLVIGALHVIAADLTALLAKMAHFEVGTSLDPLMTVVMFGVGTDYVVFLLFRHRENLAAEAPSDATGHRRVLGSSLARMSLVIASAAATVTTAFVALLGADLQALRTLGPGLMIAVVVTGLAGLTLFPAIFSLSGRFLFWPTTPRVAAHADSSLTAKMAHSVSLRPVRWAFGVAVVIAAGCTGIFSYGVTYNTLAELPSSTPSLEAYSTLAKSFPAGVIAPTAIYVSSHSTTPPDAAAVEKLQADIKAVPGVAAVGPVSSDATKMASTFNVILSSDPYSNEAIVLVRDTIEPLANHAVSGSTVEVGGTTAQLVDVKASVAKSMKTVVPLALLLVGVILVALLRRAIVAPLWVLASVVMLYAAVMGVLSLTFITLLGYDGLDFSVILIAYLFVMAIGSDYNILIVDIINERTREGHSPRSAAEGAMISGGPAVAAAALILAVTFSSMLFTNIEILEEIGVAVIITALLTAFVLASRGVPAMSVIHGRSFWWPSGATRVPVGDSEYAGRSIGHSDSTDGE